MILKQQILIRFLVLDYPLDEDEVPIPEKKVKVNESSNLNIPIVMNEISIDIDIDKENEPKKEESDYKPIKKKSKTLVNTNKFKKQIFQREEKIQNNGIV